jgi:hypothetical protein
VGALKEIPSYIEHHKLALKLKPILVGELYLARKLKFPVFIFMNGMFYPVISEGTFPTKDIITTLIRNSYREVYLYPEDIAEIKTNLENALIKITRSLSVGDPLENGTKDLKLLSLNMAGVYQNPHNDDLLMLQFQSSQNLSKFLIENKKFLPFYFQSLTKENFHFTLSQPMLSSLMLLAFLQTIHLFHEKEIENLFLASYLKDIGISLIPEGKFDSKVLSDRDKELFASHADFSFDLLEGRIPLSKNYLTIIKHHHFLNDKLKELVGKDEKKSHDKDLVLGIESTLVAVFDIVVAMTSARPYRKSLSLYQALDIIKRMMADEYPQEFRALVGFLKQFYKN